VTCRDFQVIKSTNITARSLLRIANFSLTNVYTEAPTINVSNICLHNCVLRAANCVQQLQVDSALELYLLKLCQVTVVSHLSWPCWEALQLGPTKQSELCDPAAVIVRVK